MTSLRILAVLCATSAIANAAADDKQTQDHRSAFVEQIITELKLTDEQAARFAANHRASGAKREELKRLPPTERDAKIAEYNMQQWKSIQQILTPQQQIGFMRIVQRIQQPTRRAASENNSPAAKPPTRGEFFDGTDEETRRTMEDARRRIESIRKGDFVLHLETVDGKPWTGLAEVTLTEHAFPFGTNLIGFDYLADNHPARKAATQVIDELFNEVIVCDYWMKNAYGGKNATPNWAEPDPMLAFARQHNKTPRYHAMIYGYPEWLKTIETREEQWRIIENRIQGIAERYAGAIDQYDVINEMVHDSIRYGRSAKIIRAEGATFPPLWEPKVAARVVELARQYLPDAELVVLECGIWSMGNPIFHKIIDFHKGLIEFDAPYDYIGCQAHYYASGQTPFQKGHPRYGPRTFMMDDIEKGLDHAATLGKPIVITEFSPPSRSNQVANPDQPRLSDEEVAAWQVNFYTLAFSKPYIHQLTRWFTIDNVGGRGMDAGLVTEEGEFKPAYYALKKLLKGTWHTHWTGPVSQGEITLRGFYGEYTVEVPGHAPQTVTFIEDSPRRVRVVLKPQEDPVPRQASQLEATGTVRLENVEGVWWFVSAEGKPFFSTGINHAVPNLWLQPYNRKATLARYGNDFSTIYQNRDSDVRMRWWRQVEGWMKDWNFNTHGMHTADSFLEDVSPDLYFTAELKMMKYHTAMTPDDEWPDVFSEKFARQVDQTAENVCNQHKNKHNLLGYYFTDEPAWTNYFRRLPEEAHWWFRFSPWVDFLRRLPPSAPGKQAWISVLKGNYAKPKDAGLAYGVDCDSWADLQQRVTWPVPDDAPGTRADSDAMLARIAERWYALQHAAIKRYDPHHLIFGDKHYNGVPDWLIPILEKYVDVIAIQHGGLYQEFGEHLRDIHTKTGKPIFIGDGMPAYWLANRSPSGRYTDKTEALMGQCYAQFTKNLCLAPYILGYHHCGFIQTWPTPAKKGYAARNGFVDPFGEPYKIFTEHVAAANRQADDWHKKASSQ